MGLPTKAEDTLNTPPFISGSDSDTGQEQQGEGGQMTLMGQESVGLPLSQGAYNTLINLLDTATASANDSYTEPVICSSSTVCREIDLEESERDTNLTISHYEIPQLTTTRSGMSFSSLFGSITSPVGDVGGGDHQLPPGPAPAPAPQHLISSSDGTGTVHAATSCNTPQPHVAPLGTTYQVKTEYIASRATPISPTLSTTIAPVVPSNVIYPGPFNFELSVLPPSKENISKNWTYWAEQRKLYIDRCIISPFQFSTCYPVMPGTLLRAMLIYKDPQHIKETVIRCPHHEQQDAKDKPHNYNHFIHCDSPYAVYCMDTVYRRRSVVVPFESPQVGCGGSVRVDYSFSCMTSCPGGPNRRKMQVVFTLESPQGEVMGRQVIDVRVCACPGRDRQTEEKREAARRSKQQATPAPAPLTTHITSTTPATAVANQDKSKKRGIEQVTSLVSVSKKQQKKDNKVYTIQVRGREHYELLLKIRDSLEVSSLVPEQFRSSALVSAQRRWLRVALHEQFRHLPNVVEEVEECEEEEEEGTCQSTDSEP